MNDDYLVEWRQLTLHVDTPVAGIQAEGFKGTLLAKALRLVNKFVASIIAGAGIALRVLV